MKAFTFGCFLSFVFLLLACLCVADAKTVEVKKPSDKPAAQKIEASAKRLVIESEKNGRKTRREFPVMFDIAERSVKHKAMKKKE